jgi:hypothetical protein
MIMRSSIIPGVLWLVAGLAGCSPDVPTSVPNPAQVQLSRSAAQCDNLGGTVEAHFLTPTEQASLPSYAVVQDTPADIGGTLFDGEGHAIGEAFAWIVALAQPGRGALQIEMRHRYVLNGSQLDTQDRGVLSPLDPPLYRFNNRLEVTGGTGAFAGATGFIRAHGTVVIGGDIELRYHGRLCT